MELSLEAGKEERLIASDIASMHIRRIEAGIQDYGTDFDWFDPFDLGLQKFMILIKVTLSEEMR